MRGLLTSSTLLWLMAGALAACSGSGKTPEDTGTETDSAVDSDSSGFQDLETPQVSFTPAQPDTRDDLHVEIANPQDGVSYLYQWSVDGTARSDLSGPVVLAEQTRRDQVWNVTVIGQRDGKNSAPGRASLTIGNAAPSVTVSIEPADPGDDDNLTAVVEAIDPDEDPLSLTYAWTQNGQAFGGGTKATLESVYTQAGDVWAVTVTASDGSLKSDPATASVTITSALPSIQSVTLSPANPKTADAITLSFMAQNPSGPVSALVPDITWELAPAAGGGFAVVPGVSGKTLPATYTAKGDKIRANLTVSDGTLTSLSVRSNELTVQNTAPTSTGAVVSPSGAVSSDTLTCTGQGYADADGDAEGWHYQWFASGGLILGQSASTLTPGFVAYNKSVACTAIPYDGFAEGLGVESAAVVLGNAPPVIGNLRLTPAIPAVSDVLLAEALSVVDFDAGQGVRIRFSWSINGDPPAQETTRAFGETSDTFGANFTAGDVVSVTAVPIDSLGLEGSPVTAQVSVANTPPVIDTVQITPSPIFASTPAKAVVTAHDAENANLTFHYIWKVNGLQRQAGPSDTLDTSFFRKGQTLQVTVTANDGSVDSAPFTSTLVIVSNSVPTVGEVTLSPMPITRADLLTCTAANLVDIDVGDAPQVPPGGWSWYRNQSKTSVTSPTFPANTLMRGESIQCGAYATDSTNQPGPVTRSAEQVVANTPPVLASADLNTLQPSSSDTLSVIYGLATDLDGDAVTMKVVWYVNGTVVSNQPTLTPDVFVSGDEIWAVVTPFDGFDDGLPVETPHAVGENARPRITRAQLGPLPASTGKSLTLDYEASDPDDDPIVVQIHWFHNDVEQTDLADTTEFPGARLNRADVVRAQVIVTDDKGATDSAWASPDPVVVGNTPPTLAGAVLTPTDPVRATVLSCEPDGAVDVDGDTITYRTSWYVNDAFVSAASTLGPNAVRRGDRVACGLVPLDGQVGGEGIEVRSAAVVVGNTAPQLTRVTLSPQAPKEGDTVQASVQGASDADGDTILLSYVWSVDGEVVLNAAGEPLDQPSLHSAWFDKGQSISVEVTPRDDALSGIPVASSPVTAVNSPPVLSDLSLLPTKPLWHETLGAAAFVSDPDPADTPQILWRWAVGTNTDTLIPVADADTDTLTPEVGHYQKHNLVVVYAAATDGVETTSELSRTVVVANAVPSATSVSITPAGLVARQTASCDATGWSDLDGDAEGYTYAWYVNGQLKSSTRKFVMFNRGDELQCIATPFDGEAEGTPLSSAVVTVGDTPPTLGSVAISPADPRELDVLSAITQDVGDPDPEDSLTLTFEWFVNGVSVAQGETLTGAFFDKGDQIYVVATVSDGELSVQATSSVVTVRNTVPIFSGLTLGPVPAYTTDDIVASATYSDPDPADTPQATYRWYIGNNQLSASISNTNTLPSSVTQRGDVISAAITITDGEGTFNSQRSAGLTIQNSTPTLGSLAISPESPSKATGAQCTAVDRQDADDDPVSVQISWLVNGLTVASGPTLSGNYFHKGDTLRCAGYPFDGSTEGLTVESDIVTATNTPPQIGGIILSSEAPTKANNITYTLVDVFDADDDAVQPSVTWLVDGVAVSTGATLFPNFFSRGQTIQAVVKPFDGEAYGDSAYSSIATVQNSLPVLTRPPWITPAMQVYTDTRIYAHAEAVDLDGDPITYKWRWLRNDTMLGVDEDVDWLDGTSWFDRGNDIRVEVYPVDSEGGVGETDISASLIVDDSPPTAPIVRFTPGFPSRQSEHDLICLRVGGGWDADYDALQVQWDLRINGQGYAGSETDSQTRVPGSVLQNGQGWSCGSTLVQFYNGLTSGHGLTSFVDVDGALALTCQEHTDLFHNANIFRMTEEDATAFAPFDAFCETAVAGGGWVRVIRTTGQDDDFGQKRYPVVTYYADADAVGPGVFIPFFMMEHYSEVLIVKTSGVQAGTWRRFALDSSPEIPLAQVFEGCRDEIPALENAAGVFGAVSVTGHTTKYSGTAVDGSLAYKEPDGTTRSLDYLSLCGVNLSGAHSVNYLSFMTDPEDDNDWGDDAVGTKQRGAIWSFANGPYSEAGRDTHIGGPGLSVGAGWRGESTGIQQTYHEGNYEIYLR